MKLVTLGFCENSWWGEALVRPQRFLLALAHVGWQVALNGLCNVRPSTSASRARRPRGFPECWGCWSGIRAQRKRTRQLSTPGPPALEPKSSSGAWEDLRWVLDQALPQSLQHGGILPLLRLSPTSRICSKLPRCLKRLYGSQPNAVACPALASPVLRLTQDILSQLGVWVISKLGRLPPHQLRPLRRWSRTRAFPCLQLQAQSCASASQAAPSQACSSNAARFGFPAGER